LIYNTHANLAKKSKLINQFKKNGLKYKYIKIVFFNFSGWEMNKFKISKGLNLPLQGDPVQQIKACLVHERIGIIGEDYPDLKPSYRVQVGDPVKRGEILFEDKHNKGVVYTSPVGGYVTELKRGARRKFLSMVIAVDGDETENFPFYSEKEIEGLDKEKVVEQLRVSGQLTAIRTRPFSKVASPHKLPDAVFVTAMDTRPFAPAVAPVIEGHETDFIMGIKALSRIAKVHICTDNTESLPHIDIKFAEAHTFEGPHPAGLVGTHVHFIRPVGREKLVWYVDYQDVINIGKLFTVGLYRTDKVISLGGSAVREPALYKTTYGAPLVDIILGRLTGEVSRVISGSPLYGRRMDDIDRFLGRYHNQVSVIPEGKDPRFMGWVMPGKDVYSQKNIYAAKFTKALCRFDTFLNGSKRSVVPVGNFEDVMPLDILATPLLKSIMVRDIETAEKLGALELDEEDLSLCTFLCPGKQDYGPYLRKVLTAIEKEL